MHAVRRGFEDGCRELVISGGEPTLCPDVICNIILIAEQLGYEKYIIQTNGFGVARDVKLASFLDSVATDKDLGVSFSVHGHVAAIHDKMSSSPGAFGSLMTAISRVSKTHCKLYTNTVISSLNISDLRKVAEMLLPYNPDIVQFSMMHQEEPGELTTGLLESAAAVRNLRGVVHTSVLRTEGIPYCLMYGMEECVGESFWPEKLDLYNKDDSYMPSFSQLDSGMRWKKDSCNRCIMNDVCAGIWREHAAEFTASGVRPIE